MADITPNDIINKAFRMALRGYAVDDVDDFLQLVSDSLYRALEENQRLRAQLDDLRGQLKHFQETEGLINNALVLAERTAEEVRQRAQDEAKLIRREAEQRIRSERAEVEELQQLRYRLIAELRGLLNTHLSLLETQEQRVAPSSRPRPEGEEG